jgi:hypothetical protein
MVGFAVEQWIAGAGFDFVGFAQFGTVLVASTQGIGRGRIGGFGCYAFVWGSGYVNQSGLIKGCESLLHSGRGIGGFARVKPLGGMATEGSLVAG